MPRKLGSSFYSREYYPKEGNPVSFRPSRWKKRTSDDSLFSNVTNISDTGTYEIEITERQSLDSASELSSKSTVCSESSASSKCRSSTSSKSEQSVATPNCCEKKGNRIIQSYYPCLCPSKPDMKEKTKTGSKVAPAVEVVPTDRSVTESKDELSSYVTDVKNVSSRSSTKSDGKCHCSKCSDTSSSSSSDSDDSSDYSSSEKSRSGSDSSSSDCNCTKCRGSPRESTATYTVLSTTKELKDYSGEKSADNDFSRTKTVTVALELIDEEKDKQWTEGINQLRSCKCETDKYEERLKNLENIHLSDKTAIDAESGTESRNRSCDCSITLSQFTEIKDRMIAMEKLLMDSLEKKESAATEKKDSQVVREPVPEDSYFLSVDEVKSKGEMTSVLDSIDETTRTAIELAKIKKRLIDLEEKITNEKLYNTSSTLSIKNISSRGKHKKMAVNITTYATPTRIKLSNKEIQVTDSGEDGRRQRAEKEKAFIAENTSLATYWVTESTGNCDKMRRRDEAIQTPSRREVDECSGDCDPQPEVKNKKRKRKFRLRKSCDRIHLCKECDNYIAQKLGKVRGTSSEKLWGSRNEGRNPSEDSQAVPPENIHKLKRSFNLYSMKNTESVEPKKLSFFGETKRLLDRRRKKDSKKVKLCSKCSKTNLKDMKMDSGTEGGMEFPWGAFSKCSSKKTESAKVIKERLQMGSRRSLPTHKVPRHSFQIYHAQELRPYDQTCGKGFPVHYPREYYFPDLPWAGPVDQMKAIYDCRHHLCAGYESWSTNMSCITSVTSFGSYPFRYLSLGRNIKIPVLFEEICSSKKEDFLQHQMSTTMRVVQFGANKDTKNELSPFQKLVRKLSHPRSIVYKEKFIPFGVSRCCCGNIAKTDKLRGDRRNVITLLRIGHQK